MRIGSYFGASNPRSEIRTMGSPRGAVERLLRQFHWHLDNSSESMKPIDLRIAEELGVRAQQVAAAVSLLDNGATVPFVARYRKEATGTLDDTQLRRLEERLIYLRELDERRTAILDNISQQGTAGRRAQGTVGGRHRDRARRGAVTDARIYAPEEP